MRAKYEYNCVMAQHYFYTSQYKYLRFDTYSYLHTRTNMRTHNVNSQLIGVFHYYCL